MHAEPPATLHLNSEITGGGPVMWGVELNRFACRALFGVWFSFWSGWALVCVGFPGCPRLPGGIETPGRPRCLDRRFRGGCPRWPGFDRSPGSLCRTGWLKTGSLFYVGGFVRFAESSRARCMM